MQGGDGGMQDVWGRGGLSSGSRELAGDSTGSGRERGAAGALGAPRSSNGQRVGCAHGTDTQTKWHWGNGPVAPRAGHPGGTGLSPPHP